MDGAMKAIATIRKSEPGFLIHVAKAIASALRVFFLHPKRLSGMSESVRILHIFGET